MLKAIPVFLARVKVVSCVSACLGSCFYEETITQGPVISAFQEVLCLNTLVSPPFPPG